MSLEDTLAKQDKLIGWIKVLVGGAFIVGGWVAVLQRDVSNNAGTLKGQIEVVRQNAADVERLNVWRSATEASRFTAAQGAVLETRVARVEDAIAWIKERGVSQQEQLNRIEAKIDARRTP